MPWKTHRRNSTWAANLDEGCPSCGSDKLKIKAHNFHITDSRVTIEVKCTGCRINLWYFADLRSSMYRISGKRYPFYQHKEENPHG